MAHKYIASTSGSGRCLECGGERVIGEHTYESEQAKFPHLAKVVRSKDIMEALCEVFESLKGQTLPVSEVGYSVYRKLLTVPEFQANDLQPLSWPNGIVGKELGATVYKELSDDERQPEDRVMPQER